MSDQRLKDFWNQLKKRKVVRVALSYIFVGWVVMQVGEVTLESLAVPAWSLTLLVVFILLGFPIALVLAWAYEVTPQGVRKDSAGDIESILKIEDYFFKYVYHGETCF